MVNELRKQGYQVKVVHNRIKTSTPKVDGKVKKVEEPVPFERGGYTEVTITRDDVTSKGLAVCSLNDNYCKKRGVAIALGRALKAMEDGKSHNPEGALKAVLKNVENS